MVKPFPSKTHIGNHTLYPEMLMLNYGYDPQLSERSRPVLNWRATVFGIFTCGRNARAWFRSVCCEGRAIDSPFASLTMAAPRRDLLTARFDASRVRSSDHHLKTD